MSPFFHLHDWHEVSRSVVPGALAQGKGFKFGGGMISNEARDALYGYTLVEQKCEGCDRVRIDMFTGSPVPQECSS